MEGIVIVVVFLLVGSLIAISVVNEKRHRREASSNKLVESTPAYIATTNTAGILSATSNQVSALMKRYKDAYLVANVTVGFGTLIKVAAVIVAVVIGGIGLAVAGQLGNETQQSIVMVLGAAFAGGVGAILFVLGILVSAQGQILKAALDSSVNNSPMLNNEHRAAIMSLPST